MSQPEELDDDRPWTEAQWEAFMKRSDARSAKFGELLETVRDDPDRDAIIGHEMGWDRPVSEEFQEIVAAAAEEVEARERAENDGEEDEDLNDLSLDEDWYFDDDAPSEAASADGAEDYIQKKKNALKGMHSRAFELGTQVHKALEPYCGAYAGTEEIDEDQDLTDAIDGSMMIAAKLAGAHGMGYDDDMLCGNIVCCKRSLAGADQCLRGLRALRERGFAPPEVLDPLVAEGEQVRQLVAEHIAELRSRVWWE